MAVTSQTPVSALHRARGASGLSIALPNQDSSLQPFAVQNPLNVTASSRDAERSRIFYAAPHVIASPLSGGSRAVDRIDWDATLRFRDHLWDLGLGVAEAMDTAQRGMGLSWPLAKELIMLTAERSRKRSGRLVCGASTDQLELGQPISFGDIVDAYVEQCDLISSVGAIPVLMASRSLAALATTTDEYQSVYAAVLSQTSGSVILHWLGEMFDQELLGYWGAEDLTATVDVLVDFIAAHSDRIDGIKVSVLSAEHEIAMRDRLPSQVRLYTGDDFNYPELIRGNIDGHSDALLGVFNPIAHIAAASLDALDGDDLQRYDDLMDPTVSLARVLFAAPTENYKCGIVLLSYLNGHQDHFKMLQGAESRRSVLHYADVFRLADAAGVLRDPELAVQRMRAYLTLAGVDHG